MRTKRAAVTFTAWWFTVTLATRYNHFPISPSSLGGTWSIVRAWPAADGPDVPSTIITIASDEGITCLIAHWIYIGQVITGTRGDRWLMVCVSPVHAVFVFIWQSTPLSRAAAEISVPFGHVVCAHVCVCVHNSSERLPVGHHFQSLPVSISLNIPVNWSHCGANLLSHSTVWKNTASLAR